MVNPDDGLPPAVVGPAVDQHLNFHITPAGLKSVADRAEPLIPFQTTPRPTEQNFGILKC